MIFIVIVLVLGMVARGPVLVEVGVNWLLPKMMMTTIIFKPFSSGALAVLNYELMKYFLPCGVQE